MQFTPLRIFGPEVLDAINRVSTAEHLFDNVYLAHSLAIIAYNASSLILDALRRELGTIDNANAFSIIFLNI